MASQPPRLIVFVTPDAKRNLRRIWFDNAQLYSPDHADRYVAFLDGGTMTLESEHPRGRPVPGRESLHYLTIRKGRGHGHIVVYQVVDDTIEVLRYFHTAQDWQGRL